MGLPVQTQGAEGGVRECGPTYQARDPNLLDQELLDQDLRDQDSREQQNCEGQDGGDGMAAPDREQRDRLFAELAERNQRLMFRVAHGLLRSVQDAEDAVQEALLKLYRTGGWLRMEEEKAFLARTVWRVGLDIVARRGRGAQPLGEDDGRELRAPGDSAEQSLVGHGERERLRQMIGTLPEELRQPLVLLAIEEMTSREVAAALGIPEGTVRTRALRARAELRRRFAAIEERRRKTTTDLNG